MLSQKLKLKCNLTLYFSWALLVVYSLIINDTPTLIWPAIANLPGVINMSDPSLFSQDFYAISSQGTPIVIYQKILIFIESFSGLGPFKSLGLIGGLIISFYIPTLFLLLTFALNRWIMRCKKGLKNKNQLNKFVIILVFIACVLLTQFSQIFNSAFTFMGWSPIFLLPAPYVISLLIGFTAFLFKIKYIHASLCIVSCLIHPAMGGLTIIFCSLLFTDFKSKKEIIRIALWSFLPIALTYIVLIFSFPQLSLDTKSFIDIYIKYRHPHHYLISESFLLSNYLILVIAPLSIMCLILYRLKSEMKINCFLALIAVSLIPLLHYFFTEVYALKAVAIFGGTRFFMFGLFLLIFFGVVSAIEILNSFKAPRLIRLQIYSITHLFERFNKFLSHNSFKVFILIFFMITIPIFEFMNKEFNRIEDDQIEFDVTYKNILSKIDNDDVVMVLDSDGFEFGLLGRVNLFASGAFPFSTSKFYEFKNRGDLWNGCIQNFNKDTVAEASKNYKLDFILMNKNRLLSPAKDIIMAQSDNLILIDVRTYLKSFNNQ